MKFSWPLGDTKFLFHKLAYCEIFFNTPREILYLCAAMYYTLCIFLFTGRWAYLTIIIINRNLYHAVSMEIFNCTL